MATKIKRKGPTYTVGGYKSFSSFERAVREAIRVSKEAEGADITISRGLRPVCYVAAAVKDDANV